MLKRLLLGLIVGGVVGVAIAAGLVQGLGMAVFANPFFAYVAAAVTGLITGLVAGKPIWSAGGRIEAGLKAFFGSLLALGGMFALRKWGNVHVDLASLKAGAGGLGELPAASLPILAALLGGFFELDNTPSAEVDDAKKLPAGKAAASGKKVRVASTPDEEVDELEDVAPAKKRR